MGVSNTALADLANSFLFTDTDNAGVVIAVKASSAVIYAIDVDNTANSAISYVKLWNTAAASVTIGTTAPVLILPIPASTRTPVVIPAGIAFDTAVAVATVTAAGTAGTTGPTSDVIVRIVYV
jgi:hypothetical protein